MNDMCSSKCVMPGMLFFYSLSVNERYAGANAPLVKHAMFLTEKYLAYQVKAKLLLPHL